MLKNIKFNIFLNPLVNPIRSKPIICRLFANSRTMSNVVNSNSEKVESAPTTNEKVEKEKLDKIEEELPSGEQPSELKLSLKDMASKQYWAARRERRRVKRDAGLLKKKHRPPEEWQMRRRWKDKSVDEIEWFQPTVVVDCHYDQLMDSKEIRSLKAQIMHLYGFLRIQERPLRTYICGVGSVLRSQLDSVGGANWKMTITDSQKQDLFDMSKLVYLSPGTF